MAGSAARTTSPPSPPSPPSGPPRGTNFSRRKLTQPAPPSPPLTKMSISSTNMIAGGTTRADAPGWAGRSGSGRLSQDADVARVAATLELHHAVDLGEQRVVGATADVVAGLEAGAALADQDGPAGHELPAKALDAEHLRIRIPAVARAADAFLVRHDVSYTSILVIRTAVAAS